ncbi:kinase-like domain-containing protein [Dichotomopilus funicola]|uniref:non-specific serine/threonine protein kinase n=1 Tax=Dichotomopilus funicola TaxID=1934379 RepID=A0AAN6V6D5_9PEZI|nr:kinase-like domain-containing protein [Dichotomopilus funicola]
MLRRTAPCLKYIHPAPSLRAFRSINEESLDRYCPGGYHPVRISEAFDEGRFRISNKLGYGPYSTVWLAYDKKTTRNVALKICTADPPRGGSFERGILDGIRTQITSQPGSHRILQLSHSFKHKGIHGNHLCLVFDLMGPDLEDYRNFFPGRRLPVALVKRITRQLLFGLWSLHSVCKIIHADIKPQNILTETPETRAVANSVAGYELQPIDPLFDMPDEFYIASSKVYTLDADMTRPARLAVRLADFGHASWFDRKLPGNTQGQRIQAPEVVLDAKWDHKIDIWQIGLLVWDLIEGQPLFNGYPPNTTKYNPDAHLAQMTSTLGPMPTRLIEGAAPDKRQLFSEDGNMVDDFNFPRTSLEERSQVTGMPDIEKMRYFDFLKRTLSLDPNSRPEAETLVDIPWLSSI